MVDYQEIERIKGQRMTNNICNAHVDYLLSAIAALRDQLARWKQAVEGLTPNGSEFVDDPERCAAHLRRRFNYPKQIIELREQLAQAQHKIHICEQAFELDEAVKIPEVDHLNALQFRRTLDELQSRLTQAEKERDELQQAVRTAIRRQP